MTNLIVSAIYVVTIFLARLGDTWIYYIIGSIVELALLLAIGKVAWSWRMLR